jgi:hypothetical protein
MDSTVRSPPSQSTPLRRCVDRLERVPVEQPVRVGSTNQLTTPQLSQLEHLGRRHTLGSLRRRSTLDTLMAALAVPVGAVFAEIPLQYAFGQGASWR